MPCAVVGVKDPKRDPSLKQSCCANSGVVSNVKRLCGMEGDRKVTNSMALKKDRRSYLAILFVRVVLLLLLSVVHAQQSFSVRKLAATNAPRVLNVHVVPHTHDDVGWRKTVDQYFYGLNNTIDRRGSVHSILSTAVQALTEHPSRTFTYTEQKFFAMWWNEQNEAVQDTVRYLVANQQLTFVNGGWCMHDEAAAHYIGMIDQTTTGHQFLLHQLGVTPVTGWQLDPFGHSATHASLLTYAAGMDALYFGRIDYQDLARRKATAECEGVWQASASSPSATVFWGLTGSYGGNYHSPDGFGFDVLSHDEPLVGANTTRLLERVTDFFEAIQLQSNQTRGNNIMLTMGADFTVRYYSTGACGGHFANG